MGTYLIYFDPKFDIPIYLIKSWSNRRSKSAVFGKTIRAKNINFWVKVDQICVNKIIKGAFEIFHFLPPKNFQKEDFFFLSKKVANFKGLQYIFFLLLGQK